MLRYFQSEHVDVWKTKRKTRNTNIPKRNGGIFDKILSELVFLSLKDGKVQTEKNNKNVFR